MTQLLRLINWSATHPGRKFKIESSVGGSIDIQLSTIWNNAPWHFKTSRSHFQCTTKPTCIQEAIEDAIRHCETMERDTK